MRKVRKDEYDTAMARSNTSSLVRWCVLMVCHAYLSGSEIEYEIIKTATHGD
jgi:hypothetical protein